jgi:Domain of unknown function (DUF4347)
MARAEEVTAVRSGLHVLIIGRRDPISDDDLVLEDLYARVQHSTAVAVARCDDPALLIGIVQTLVERPAAATERNLIATLDLFDHGGEGRMRLGKRRLSLGQTKGGPAVEPIERAAGDLRDYLTPDARVRLLGCETACGLKGQQLLLGLHAWLNEGGATERLAYGALYSIKPESVFDDQGRFDADESIYLFSSREAEAGVAPPLKVRIEQAAAQASALPTHAA